MYMHVHPTGIHDLRPDKTISAKQALVVEEDLRILNVRESKTLTKAQQNTFLTMVEKAQPFISGGYSVAPVKIPVYEMSNVFQNEYGLVSTYDSILVGPSKAAADAWSTVEMSKITPSVDVDIAFVAPFTDDMAKSAAAYCLKYLGKIFAMRSCAAAGTMPHGEFLGEKSAACQEALQLFSWPESTIPVLKREPNFQAYCRKAFVWMPQDDAAALITGAEVIALRKALRIGWTPKVQKEHIVCVIDKAWITVDFVNDLEATIGHPIECVTADTPAQEIVRVCSGAKGLLCFDGGESWAWALPAGATLWNVQAEMKPSLDAAVLSAAAGLTYTLFVVPRMTGTTADRSALLKKIGATITGSGAADAVATVPTLYMPDSTGFFAHAGDSFREMARLWAEKGYVNIVTQKGLANIWLGGVGETLLYDRPTLEWFNRGPIAEKKWKRALFGNPEPLANATTATATPWFFWPRRPALVEKLIGEGVGSAGVQERTKGTVFYGRSENSVQMSRRTALNWEAGFTGPTDEFVHLEGETPYPFTQEEYLRRLGSARFGLCLAGYGRKCHREIECMATGCVPLITPDVDIKSYANPPKEGIHYLRVETPADISRVTKLTPEAWATMSNACRVWWRKNASVEGSWELTQRLLSHP